MGGGDRVARVTLRLPPELMEVVKMASKRRHFGTINASIKFLLETHPYIRQIIDELDTGHYRDPQQPPIRELR